MQKSVTWGLVHKTGLYYCLSSLRVLVHYQFLWWHRGWLSLKMQRQPLPFYTLQRAKPAPNKGHRGKWLLSSVTTFTWQGASTLHFPGAGLSFNQIMWRLEKGGIKCSVIKPVSEALVFGLSPRTKGHRLISNELVGASLAETQPFVCSQDFDCPQSYFDSRTKYNFRLHKHSISSLLMTFFSWLINGLK